MRETPNILLVAGTGRNIGKTILACRILEQLAKNHEPVGIKISPHFHPMEDEQEYVYQSENFGIIEEKSITKKDSSRMLQAGSARVFYVQCKKEYLSDALERLFPLLNQKAPVVVESGGLYDLAEPGLLLYISGNEIKKKIQIRPESNVIALSQNEVKDFKEENIHFANGKFTINA